MRLTVRAAERSGRATGRTLADACDAAARRIRVARRRERMVMLTRREKDGLVRAAGDALQRGEHFRVVLTGHVQHAERTLVEGAEDRVIDEDQVARLLDTELHDRRAASRHE